MLPKTNSFSIKFGHKQKFPKLFIKTILCPTPQNGAFFDKSSNFCSRISLAKYLYSSSDKISSLLALPSSETKSKAIL